MVKELSQEQVEGWVREMTGAFNLADLRREREIFDEKNITKLRSYMGRLVERGVITRDPKKDGRFFPVDGRAPEIDFKTAQPADILPVVWPQGFGLEDLVAMYKKNIAVIAGSPDAGKTAFLLNVAKENMWIWDVDYYSSEMGAEEFRMRTDLFEDVDEWNIKVRDRSNDFSQVIHPDHLTIIDYLEVINDFYLVAAELNAIFNKLRKGIAVVALQKKRGAALGRGAEFSLEKPRLYLSMDSGKLTIEKAKNWVDYTNNPNGFKYTFKLVKGCKFVQVQRSLESP